MALEQRFARLPDGSVWTQMQCDRAFWRRYLDVFDEVRCLARVREVATLVGEWHRADGPEVSFSAIPYYVGVTEFLRKAATVSRAVRDSVQPGDAFVLRVPGNMGRIAWRKLNQSGYPYGVEVLGDPFEAFAPGAVHHPLRGLLRWLQRYQLRAQCARSCAASYVTDRTLQRRYPSGGPAVGASSIELSEDAFVSKPRSIAYPSGTIRLVFVGSLEQYTKAADVLIEAFARTLRDGLDGHLAIVGDGKHRPELEALAERCGCSARVRFAGRLAAGARIVEELDRADLFVLPSRSEGLPRAMIEAMARGLPCIGSNAGGIPELLPANVLVPVGDPEALAAKIYELAGDAARRVRLSATNIERARAYRSDVLRQRRMGFYRHVRAATESWLRSRPSLPAA